MTEKKFIPEEYTQNPESSSELTEKKEWSPEVLLELPDTTELFNQLMENRDERMFIFEVNAEGDFTWEPLGRSPADQEVEKIRNESEALKEIVKAIIARELKDGPIDKLALFIVRSKGENLSFDQWHKDGIVKYLFANKHPTLYLPDESGEYQESFRKAGGENLSIEPVAQDVKSYPANGLVRQSSTTIHKRPDEAGKDDERFLLTVMP